MIHLRSQKSGSGLDEEILSLPEEHEGEADIAQTENGHSACACQEHDGIGEPVEVVEHHHFDVVQKTTSTHQRKNMRNVCFHCMCRKEQREY